MSVIAEINDSEIKTVKTRLNERWNKNTIDLQQVIVEAKLNQSDNELSECAALYWEHSDCHFIIIKTGENQYLHQYYYGNSEQFTTGTNKYTEIGDCVLSVLRLQADHERERSQKKDNKS